MSAAIRSIDSRTDWTSVFPKAPWTTSRKAEMVGDKLTVSAFAFTFTDQRFSIQHPDGFHLCHIPMADHVEAGHEEVGKTGALCCHVFGMLRRSSITECTEHFSLTFAKSGYGHRDLNGDPNSLEIPRQRQRRVVLLAPRHVGHLVLLRGCRDYYRTVRSSAAGAGQRCPFDAPLERSVKAAGVYGGLRAGWKGRTTMVPCEVTAPGKWFISSYGNGVSAGVH